jgi:hypothetical protein
MYYVFFIHSSFGGVFGERFEEKLVRGCQISRRINSKNPLHNIMTVLNNILYSWKMPRMIAKHSPHKNDSYER